MIPSRLLMGLFCGILLSAPLHAAEGKKKKGGPAPAPAKTGPHPSLRLEPLVKKMDAALILFDVEDERPANVPNEAAVLRAEFAGQYTAAKTDKRRAVFDAAMVVCDRIAFANEERRKMKARVNASGSFHGKGKVGSKKKGSKDDERFFADQIRADWKIQRNDLLDQINKSFLKLKEAEARAQE